MSSCGGQRAPAPVEEFPAALVPPRRTVACMYALLRGGPGDGQVVDAPCPEVVWRSCLYERTAEVQEVRGREVRVYVHRADCCEGYGRGDVDGCE